MSQSAAPDALWKKTLLNRKESLKIALETNDATNIHHTTSFHATKSTAPATILSRAQRDERWNDIKAIVEDIARQFEIAATGFKSDVKSKIEASNDRNTEFAHIIIIKKRDLVKEDINNQLDTATDKVIEIIEKLPDDQQDPAVDAYGDSIDFVPTLVDLLNIDDLVVNIPQFISGNFDPLEKWYSNIKIAVDKALRAIDGVFS
ncbi:hypothetical protein ZTR_06250 [Talaromyces verruculosus]|nr:hypothetical protein ZTR_06250 [Talaromyces verruculosus]